MIKSKINRQELLFHNYFERLKNIALSVFKWENLPDTCNERFLEKTLFEYGQAVFVNDPEQRFLNLKVTQSDTLNVYDEPLTYTAFSTGYNREFPADECVFIRNNYLTTATEKPMLIFAERLAALECAIDVNVNAQKTPILIRCDEKTRLTLEKVYEQYKGDKPVIFGSKSLQDKPLEVLITGAPFLADKLRDEKRAVWNEALEFMGINTNPSERKKERLIVDEVDANNEQIDIQAITMLLCREKACEEINKMFGLNVSVSLRKDDLVKESEVLDNGNVHNRTA